MRRVPLFDNREIEDQPSLELPVDALQRTAVDSVEIGMYVSALDKPWSDCQMAVRGFFIRSKQDLIDIKAECQYVTVDTTVTNQAKKAKQPTRLVFGGTDRDNTFNW